MARKVAWNTIIQSIGRLLTLLLGLVLLKIITNKLGAEISGQYLLAVTYSQLFNTLADLGINAYITRDINRNKSEQATVLFKRALSIRLVTSTVLLLTAVVLIFTLDGYSAGLKLVIDLALISGFIMLINSTLVAVYQGMLKTEVPVLTDLLARIMIVVGVGIVSVTMKSISIIMVIIIAAYIINFLINWLFLFRITNYKTGFISQDWYSTLKSTLPIWITSILVLVYFKVDSVMLSILPLPNGKNNIVEVGYYGTAYKYLEIIISFPQIFLGTMMPAMSAISIVDKDKFKKYLQLSFNALSIIGLPILVGSFILARPIILFISSSEFLPAVPALQVLIFAFLLSAIGGIFTYAVLSIDKQKKMILPYIIASIFNIVCNYFAIQRYSFMGAAVTTVVTELMVAIFAYFVLTREVAFKPNALIFGKALLSSLVMGLALWYFRDNNLILNIILAIILYILIMGLFKGIDMKNLKLSLIGEDEPK